LPFIHALNGPLIPSMNIHHLELFYYVARHGGVSAAARKMPYGIQQPAISAQVLRLEQDLGVTLFQRRPFRLTSAGDELYRFIEPFFGGLADVGRRLRGGEEAHLSIGAQEMILREYVPPILRSVRARVPKFSVSLQSLALEEIEARLLAQQLDIGLAAFSGKVSEGLRFRVIIELAPCLLVPDSSTLKSSASLWKRGRIDEALVCMAPSSPLCRSFQQELESRGAEWPPSLELPSIDLVTRYVVDGYGIGLSVQLPGAKAPAGTRIVGLPGFPKLPVVAIWMGMMSAVEKVFVEEAESFARKLTA
jgi:DNA-binding transcriptional LysR family regulator